MQGFHLATIIHSQRVGDCVYTLPFLDLLLASIVDHLFPGCVSFFMAGFSHQKSVGKNDEIGTGSIMFIHFPQQ